MRHIIVVLFTLSLFDIYGQNAQEYLNEGVEHHRMKAYDLALQNYNLAIEKDDQLTAAYFNRGTVFLALGNLEDAKKDFTHTIELDNSFIRAFYSRASISVKHQDYLSAIEDLNKVIALDERFPNALTLRGNLRIAEDDVEGGCNDFKMAFRNGDKNAKRFLENNCEIDSVDFEFMQLSWKNLPNWKLANKQENIERNVEEYLLKEENFNNWTEMITVQTVKGITAIGLQQYMKIVVEQNASSCPNAKITQIEQNPDADFPWIVFSIECNENNISPSYQLWLVMQGDFSLHAGFLTLKDKVLINEEKNTWISFLKTAEIKSIFK